MLGETSPKKCPVCDTVSPASAERCHCGYDFRTKKVANPVPAARRPIVWAAAWCGLLLAANLLWSYFIFNSVRGLLTTTSLRGAWRGRSVICVWLFWRL